jgi:bifunctional UDP-N-acetylglucosamine pyrophosphorylase/glucosamine-1-phosphate N-acetyltransferase
MVKFNFKQPTFVDNQAQLQALFGTDRVSLDISSSVIFEGVITLGSEIVFSGNCQLGSGTSVGNGCILTNVALGPGNNVRPYSILSNMKAESRNLFGPFCFIRDECAIGNDCILGAHVEITRSVFASGVKISHRAFVGDAQVGERTIIGAGVVFCNFDGTGRRSIQVGSDVTLGSGALLVAPLSIGDHVTVAAGSTVTKDVPTGSKVIQRRQ